MMFAFILIGILMLAYCGVRAPLYILILLIIIGKLTE